MTAKFTELIDVLEKELAALTQFDVLLDSEYRCLKSFDHKSLDRCNIELENLALQMDALEQTRARFVKQMAARFGMDASSATLSLLAQKAPGAISVRLLFLRDKIKAIVKKIDDRRETNRVLILSGMRLLQGLRKVVEDTINPKLTYSAHGRRNKGKSASAGVGRI